MGLNYEFWRKDQVYYAILITMVAQGLPSATMVRAEHDKLDLYPKLT